MVTLQLRIIIILASLLMMSCASPKATPPVSHLMDNRDGTYIDIETLVQWPKSDTTPGPARCLGGDKKSYWYLGMYLECLNRHRYLGHNDWRLPSYEEMDSLLATPEIANDKLFAPEVRERLEDHQYWSTADLSVYIRRRGVMIYNLIGDIYRYRPYSRYFVWPVRSDHDDAVFVDTSVDMRYTSPEN